MSEPNRIVLDLKNASSRIDFGKLQAIKPLKRLRSALRENGSLRIVLDVNGDVAASRAFGAESRGGDFDLIVDIPKSKAILETDFSVTESKRDVVVAISQSGTTAALIDSVKIVRKNGVKVIGIMPGDTPLANICDFPLTINIGINNRISKPLTSRIAYTAVIDVLTMGVAQLKPEAQDHLYNLSLIHI